MNSFCGSRVNEVLDLRSPRAVRAPTQFRNDVSPRVVHFSF
jgi:hypothetical protein